MKGLQGIFRATSPVISSTVLLLSLLSLPFASGRKLTLLNTCTTTIWPGIHTGAGALPNHTTGWELPSGSKTVLDVPEQWTAGRIWARTGCVVENGVFQCLTGGCGAGQAGDMTCQGTNEPPATLAEFTLAAGGADNYDISLVDGFNIPMTIHASVPACQSPTCGTNINALCPAPLRFGLDAQGRNLGCLAACNAGFGQEKYGNRACCSGGYDDPELCAICGVDYYHLFKDNCQAAYAYAYDEKSGTALWTCPETSRAEYTIEFCPKQAGYVGPATPATQYLHATATCSNKVVAFHATFPVPPSPTLDLSSGTARVVATVSPGVDGAAAFATGGGTGVGSESQATGRMLTPSTRLSPTRTSPARITPTHPTPASQAATASDPGLHPLTGAVAIQKEESKSPSSTTRLTAGKEAIVGDGGTPASPSKTLDTSPLATSKHKGHKYHSSHSDKPKGRPSAGNPPRCNRVSKRRQRARTPQIGLEAA